MLNKLKNKLKSMVSEEPIDPSRFEDPIASKTEWEPLVEGGTSFKTHSLKADSAYKIEYIPTKGAMAVCYIFIGMGLLSLILFLGQTIKNGGLGMNADTIMPILFFVIFSGVGGFMRNQMKKPIVFDKNIGFYWKGYKAPSEVFNHAEIKDCLELKQIYAFQLLSERCSSSSSDGESSSYYSYELNIVTHDGSRFNVIDHGKVLDIRSDASTLGSYLDVPVWDAIRG